MEVKKIKNKKRNPLETELLFDDDLEEVKKTVPRDYSISFGHDSRFDELFSEEIKEKAERDSSSSCDQYDRKKAFDWILNQENREKIENNFFQCVEKKMASDEGQKGVHSGIQPSDDSGNGLSNSVILKRRIVALRSLGYSYSQIVKEVGCSKSYVQKVLKNNNN